MKKQYSNRSTIIKRARILVMVFVLSIATVSVFAQGDPGTPTGPDPDAPIDGGLSLLVAAGVGYGVKKVREKRKKQEAEAGIEK
jgi:hypothetical protein